MTCVLTHLNKDAHTDQACTHTWTDTHINKHTHMADSQTTLTRTCHHTLQTYCTHECTVASTQKQRRALTDSCILHTTGGWWHLKWGGRARSNGWNGINAMVLNTWFQCVGHHSIYSVQGIIMRRPSLHQPPVFIIYVCTYLAFSSAWPRCLSFVSNWW